MYTKRADEACTGFSVLRSRGTQCSNQNLDRTHGGHRYLVPQKAASVLGKITEVALVRWIRYNDPDDDYASKGYDGMSGEIGNDDSDYTLHLMWKTVKARGV